MMKRRSLRFVIVFGMLAAGCNTPAATPFPITTGTTPPASTRPPETSTAAATLTHSPTMEMLTSTPDISYYATGTAIAGRVIAVVQPRTYASQLSPDGKWRADILIYDCVQFQMQTDEYAYDELRLVQVEGGKETAVDSQVQSCGGVGAYGLGGLIWSPNSRYLYYTDAREGFPDGLCGYWARPIHRFDINFQKVEQVGAGPLSPDRTKLAIWLENEIVIRSLNEGEIARVPVSMPDAFQRAIAWSPDSQSLVYLQTELDCFPVGKSYVTQLNLRDMSQSLLVESETPGFSNLAWDAPNLITLFDAQDQRWGYDLASRELRAAP